MTQTIQAREADVRESRWRFSWPELAALLLVLGFAAAAGYLLHQRITALEHQVTSLDQEVQASTVRTRGALVRASRAERHAERAAQGRLEAEQAGAQSAQQADQARQEASTARQDAQTARDEVERLRQARDAELNRLQKALGQIADTQRTALGLVMTLGSDSIKFDFDQSVLRPENRELLSRIAGVLLTARGFRIQVYGHTDDVGSAEYNQQLSERRAQAVRDYFVEAGVDTSLISTKGFGKSSPRVQGTSAEARAKNRRVEIAITDSAVTYNKPVLR